MQGDATLLIGLGTYLLLMIGIGIACARLMGSVDDYAIGGRRLGPWVTAISERASGESAWFLLGLPGAAYALGFTEFWSVIGIAFGIFASWTLIALPLRKETERLGAITLPEYFARRFGDRGHVLRLLATVIILAFYTFYVAAQFVGAGQILNATFGLPVLTGLLIGAGIVVLYTLAGGFLAVAWTDLVQGLLMAAVSFVLPLLALVHLGGPSGFLESVSDRGPEFLAMNGGETGRAFVFGVMIGSLSWGFGYLGQPHLLTRYMAIRKPSQVRQGTAIAMSWVLIAYWGAMFVGLTGAGVFGGTLEDPEQVMPLMAKTLLPGWIAGFFIAGAVAAMMSTADSQLLVAGSSLVEDVYAKLLHRGEPLTPARSLLMGRVATLVVALVAMGLAVNEVQAAAAAKEAGVERAGLIYAMVAYAWSGLGSSFGPPLVLSLWWRRTTRAGVLAGMSAGLLTTIVWKRLPASELTEVLDLKFVSFAVALLATWLVSLSTRAPESR